MKEYKTVPGPMGYELKEGHANEAFADFANIINEHCVDGWDYHSMETISITENPGCFGGGKDNAKTTNYYMLIFAREKKTTESNVEPVV